MIVSENSIHYQILGDNAVTTKLRDDGCIPSVEPEEDETLTILEIIMISLVALIVLLIILLIILLFMKKCKHSKTLPVVIMKSFVY